MGAEGAAGAPSTGGVEQRWDWLLRVAARVAGTPMAAISLVDEDRTMVRCGLGIASGILAPSESLCAVVVAGGVPLVLADAAADPRASALPIVTGPPHVRFFVGLPIPGPGGAGIGALSCMDSAPRPGPMAAADLDLLADLAAQLGEGMRCEADAARLIARHAQLERELQAVVDAIPLPLLTIDRAGVVTTWNPAAERVFGWTAAEAVGRFGPHVPPDQIGASRAVQAPAARGERVVGLEVECWRKDGTRLPVAVSTVPLRDAAGQPDGAVVILEDISARKRAAAEAAQRAARTEREAALLTGLATSRHAARGDAPAAIRRILAAAVEHLGGCEAALWRLDPERPGFRLAAMTGADGVLLAEAEPRRAALRDLPAEAGLAADRTVAAEDLAAGPHGLPALAPRFLAAGYGAVLLAPIRVAARLDGVVAVLAPGGRRAWTVEDRGFLASLGDLSALTLEAERRAAAMQSLEEAKERAEAANLTKSRFLARMSHELRTPLNAIIGFGELLRDGTLPAAQRQEFAGHVITAGRELLAALTAVLDHARVESGALVLARDRVDPWAVITAAVAAVAPEAAGRGLTLERSDRPMPALLGDAERLRQAIGNLLSNAVKFSPAEGRVSIGGGFDPGSGYAIWVRDSGPGMTREEMARALEPFRQLEEGLNRPAGGTGLGLPLARAFVEAHGGRLVLDSTPGRGTLAIITLPPELAVPPEIDLPRSLSAS